MGKAYTVYIETENGETLGIEGGHSFDENFKELEKAVLDRQRVLDERVRNAKPSANLGIAKAAENDEKPGQAPDMTIPV